VGGSFAVVICNVIGTVNLGQYGYYVDNYGPVENRVGNGCNGWPDIRMAAFEVRSAAIDYPHALPIDSAKLQVF
jgi:hypothetical protein